MNIKNALGITTVSKYEEFNNPNAIREELLGRSGREVKSTFVEDT